MHNFLYYLHPPVPINYLWCIRIRNYKAMTISNSTIQKACLTGFGMGGHASV